MSDSQITIHPFIKEFTKAILKTYNPSIKPKQLYTLNADLVPRIKVRDMESSIMHSENNQMFHQNRQMPRPPIQMNQKPMMRMPPRRPQMQMPQKQPMTPPKQTNTEPPKGDYGKLNTFIRNPSISSIECPGPGKQITIIKEGQKQLTNISLNPKEIKDLLEEIAANAHVPLIDGVFKAAVDNFIINAVISEQIGSRFLIKKETPYALLENNRPT